MHRSELEDSIPCAACGAETGPGSARGYGFGSDAVLCWQCGVDRGGSYDAERERWVTAPRVGDLAREER
jgi:hypothetical protein